MATAPKSEILDVAKLVNYQDGSVVSRQITKAEAGNITLFAFDQDQGLSEHTAPFDALAGQSRSMWKARFQWSS